MGYEIEKPDFVFGEWAILSDGSLSYKDGYYTIERESLKDKDWLFQMSTKDWINWNDFVPAYIQALKLIGVKELKITVAY